MNVVVSMHIRRSLLSSVFILLTSASGLPSQLTKDLNDLRTLERLNVGYELPIEIVAFINHNKPGSWMRNFELEIKNISPKPIYGVFFDLSMPDDKGPSGSPVAVSLSYGRPDLVHPSQLPIDNDKHLEPGESATISVSEPWCGGYEAHIASANVSEEAMLRLRLFVVAINFGDGSGFINCGAPFPRSFQEYRPHHFVRMAIHSK